jgi:hypothetical protein
MQPCKLALWVTAHIHMCANTRTMTRLFDASAKKSTPMLVAHRRLQVPDKGLDTFAGAYMALFVFV